MSGQSARFKKGASGLVISNFEKKKKRLFCGVKTRNKRDLIHMTFRRACISDPAIVGLFCAPFGIFLQLVLFHLLKEEMDWPWLDLNSCNFCGNCG